MKVMTYNINVFYSACIGHNKIVNFHIIYDYLEDNHEMKEIYYI